VEFRGSSTGAASRGSRANNDYYVQSQYIGQSCREKEIFFPVLIAPSKPRQDSNPKRGIREVTSNHLQKDPARKTKINRVRLANWFSKSTPQVRSNSVDLAQERLMKNDEGPGPLENQ